MGVDPPLVPDTVWSVEETVHFTGELGRLRIDHSTYESSRVGFECVLSRTPDDPKTFPLAEDGFRIARLVLRGTGRRFHIYFTLGDNHKVTYWDIRELA